MSRNDEAEFFLDDTDEEDESEIEQFKCLALQHRTNDYLATLVRDPKMVIQVHVQDSPEGKPKATQTAKRRKAVKPQQIGERTLVRHFSEEVNRIEILPEARFTLICLKTAIYVYSTNSRDLYDIVPCSYSSISSAIYRSYEKKLVLSYVSKNDPGETVEVHDYTINPRSGMDTVFTIAKPFSSGYKIGGI